MAYKNGINGHKASVVKSKDVNYFDHKTFSLSQVKSRTLLKNGYKYVRFQGVYYTVKVNRAWSNAPLTVWLGEKATILLIDEKSMNIINDFYKENDKEQTSWSPDFNDLSVSRSVKETLQQVCSEMYYPFSKNTYKMSELMSDILFKKWCLLKNNEHPQRKSPTLQSVLEDANAA